MQKEGGPLHNVKIIHHKGNVGFIETLRRSTFENRHTILNLIYRGTVTIPQYNDVRKAVRAIRRSESKHRLKPGEQVNYQITIYDDEKYVDETPENAPYVLDSSAPNGLTKKFVSRNGFNYTWKFLYDENGKLERLVNLNKHTKKEEKRMKRRKKLPTSPACISHP